MDFSINSFQSNSPEPTPQANTKPELQQDTSSSSTPAFGSSKSFGLSQRSENEPAQHVQQPPSQQAQQPMPEMLQKSSPSSPQPAVPQKMLIGMLVSAVIILLSSVLIIAGNMYRKNLSSNAIAKPAVAHRSAATVQNNSLKTSPTATSVVRSATPSPVIPVFEGNIMYKIDIPPAWETDFEPDDNSFVRSKSTKTSSQITLIRNHPPKTDLNDSDVVQSYDSTRDTSLFEAIIFVDALESDDYTSDNLLADLNKEYDDQQAQLAEMEANSQDPCGPWFKKIRPTLNFYQGKKAIFAPYEPFCMYESAIESEYFGVWYVFPSQDSLDYVKIEYSYSKANESASNAAAEFEKAIEQMQITKKDDM